jgi:Werner syndrome ATP-dependent helicase
MDLLFNSYNEILNNFFGYKTLKQEQFDIINEVLNNSREICAILTTGFGKSICYQMPFLITGKCVIVISPLIALMTDQEDFLKSICIPVVCFNSNNKNKSDEINKILLGEYKIIYMTPEFLVYCENFLKELYEQDGICMIAIDESHCVSTWGHDFRKSYIGLSCFKEWIPKVPILTLTATATKKVRTDICNILKLDNPKIIIGKFDRPNLYIAAIEKTKNSRKDIEALIHKYKDSYIILYCLTKDKTDEIAKIVRNMGINCEAYHAGLSNTIRDEVQQKFSSGVIKCIAATIAFGMGINKKNIRLIIHYGCPKNLESYYQEIGRAGRDDLASECYLFYSSQDFLINKNFINNIVDKTQKIYQLGQIKNIERYVNTSDCRRKLLLAGFDEIQITEKCNNCDNCKKNKVNYEDYSLDCYKILSLIKEFNGNRGIGFFIDVLRGSKNQKMTKIIKDNILYGIGSNHTIEYWKKISKNLLLTDYLDEKKIDNSFGSTITCSKKGILWLNIMNKENIDIFCNNLIIKDENKILFTSFTDNRVMKNDILDLNIQNEFDKIRKI